MRSSTFPDVRIVCFLLYQTSSYRDDKKNMRSSERMLELLYMEDDHLRLRLFFINVILLECLSHE